MRGSRAIPRREWMEDVIFASHNDHGGDDAAGGGDLPMLSLLAAQAIAASAPTTIVPKYAATFSENFVTWDAGPDANAKTWPLHRWRTVDKGGSTTMFGNDTQPTDSAFRRTPYYLSVTATKGSDGKWRSGYASTKFSFAQLRGYFEFDANVPVCTKGAWPALWMIPAEASYIWPQHGEIDVLEAVGDGKIYQSYHSITAPKGGVTRNTPVSCQRGWHTYGVLWRKDTLSFYIDRKLTHSTRTPSDYTRPMYLIFNLAMGGGWAGKPTVTREQMFVRRVTAWPEQ